MPVVLVVDDSEVDRQLVAGLLPRDLDWLIETAENGLLALEQMRFSLPDVVITDMLMPEMGGMELVGKIRISYPQLPVVLITGHGSESSAVEALERGATSYVPKLLLAEKLLETVEQVLALARADRSYDRLIGCLDETEFVFSLDNDPALIPPLVDLIQQMLAGMCFCGTTDRMHAGIALEEAMLNAVLCGNLEMNGREVQEARCQLRHDATSDLIEQRRRESPFKDRVTQVTVHVAHDRAEFVITDQGRGFDTSILPRRHDPQTLAQRSGRGLVLMKNFMDDVRFNDEGNELTMALKRTVGP